MKTFAKSIIAISIFSLFISSPIFAQDYVFKSRETNSSSGNSAESTTVVIGPYYVEAIEMIDSTQAKTYLKDSSGKYISITSTPPSFYMIILSTALSTKSAVYLFLESSTTISNVGVIY
jgi:hypothetical protein